MIEPREVIPRIRALSELDDPADIEILYWVGCAAAADDRVANVARCMVRIMTRAGVRFAVLGAEERCTGDVARRTGNELQFDTLVRGNIATLARYSVKRIVTHCPHCFHTLRNEYPELGGTYDVVHHSEFLRELLASGRLRVTIPLNDALTFHDPCYLSRHNGITAAPREVLHQIGVKQVEMGRSGTKSFCCGAGGGHAFFEERAGGRINENRAREAVATGVRTVATACPFCLPMMEDGLRGVAPVNDIRVRDLAELVDEALSLSS